MRTSAAEASRGPAERAVLGHRRQVLSQHAGSVKNVTTVIGNVAGRLHPDAIIAAPQVVTRRWWATAANRYELFASDLVLDECRAGDPAAAAERMNELDCTPEQLLEAYDDS